MSAGGAGAKEFSTESPVDAVAASATGASLKPGATRTESAYFVKSGLLPIVREPGGKWLQDPKTVHRSRFLRHLIILEASI
jgi:hypothetical protein